MRRTVFAALCQSAGAGDKRRAIPVCSAFAVAIASAAPARLADAARASSDLPSVFTAVQEQLGLKLEETKAALPVLVIDHIELPAED